jgi:hypothetical protein
MMRFALAAVAASLIAAPAMAVGVFNGSTTDGPTWQRPLADGSGFGVNGTNVAYEAVRLTVSADGDYTFLNEATNPVNWDNFMFLYVGSFDPADQLTNYLIGNDDFSGIGRSGFEFSLLSTNVYFVVTTGFGNLDQGDYTLSVRGPGDVVFGGGGAVPEPASWAMLIAGFGVVGAMQRRRKTVAA